jgi:hypothetical protein
LPLRTVALLVVTALALTAATASAAPTAAQGISPSLVHQGQRTTLTAKAGIGPAPCRATLQFSDGKTMKTAARAPRKGHVSFVVTIPASAGVGQGRWSVSCKSVITAIGSFVVVSTKSTTSDTTPKVVVAKQGFSQKPDPYGTGSRLSFGLILHNDSATEDADNVYVIVNMVTASGVLIGSVSRTIPLVQSGTDYAYGDSFGLRTQEPATSLEITVRVGAHEPKKTRTMPDFANVRIVPAQFSAGFVGEVDGEIVNDNSPLTLTNSAISIVVLDASGNPVGGGSGYSTAALPPNTRFVFLAQQGFDAIPLSKAATVLISTTPTYGPAL